MRDFSRETGSGIIYLDVLLSDINISNSIANKMSVVLRSTSRGLISLAALLHAVGQVETSSCLKLKPSVIKPRDVLRQTNHVDHMLDTVTLPGDPIAGREYWKDDFNGEWQYVGDNHACHTVSDRKMLRALEYVLNMKKGLSIRDPSGYVNPFASRDNRPAPAGRVVPPTSQNLRASSKESDENSVGRSTVSSGSSISSGRRPGSVGSAKPNSRTVDTTHYYVAPASKSSRSLFGRIGGLLNSSEKPAIHGDFRELSGHHKDLAIRRVLDSTYGSQFSKF